ncbi:MAG: hypothetical protein AAGI38_02625 [Bacteroidota bacterium]
MKAITALLITLAFFLGLFVAHAQNSSFEPDSFHEAAYAYTGYEADSPDKSAFVLAESDTEQVPLSSMPEVINLDQVRQSIVYYYAAECISLKGELTVNVYVDREGKYVTHLMDEATNFQQAGHFIQDLQFYPAMIDQEPVATWMQVTLLFD